MPSKIDLWQRIRDFELDGAGDAFPFSQRLRRENGWSRDQALGAIEEYKKFIYLLCVSPSALTPSEAVDQVWHLHLVYTRSYWTRFCNDVLGRPIHHEPTKGGQAQGRLFHDQYAETCALYEAEFGCAPPIEFWPPVAERFAAAPRLQWVDRRRHWLVAKPAGVGGFLRWAAAVPFVFLASCASVEAESEVGASGGSFLGPLIALAVFILVSWLTSGSRRDKKDKTDNESGNSGWSWGSGCSDGGGCGGGCGGCGG